MTFETILGTLSPREFIADYFLRFPVSMPSAAAGCCDLANWSTVTRLLGIAKPEQILICRDGERISVDKAREPRCLFETGCTLSIQHAEACDDRLHALADDFRGAFNAPIDVHLYATPKGHFGFGWHYDAEDVFIIQTEGCKTYSLRKNTVNPWPLVDTLPANMAYERELMPVWNCTLQAGDWLYIPNGYWHRATADTDSISLAVGILPATGVDLFDAVRNELIHSMLWRQRLPLNGTAAGLNDEEVGLQYGKRVAELAADLAQLLSRSTFVPRLLEYLEVRAGREVFD